MCRDLALNCLNVTRKKRRSLAVLFWKSYKFAAGLVQFIALLHNLFVGAGLVPAHACRPALVTFSRRVRAT